MEALLAANPEAYLTDEKKLAPGSLLIKWVLDQQLYGGHWIRRVG